MLKTLARVLRHRWLDASDARRAVPPEVSARLQRRVAASELRHTGEVRICIEGGLPFSYLWRHLRDGVPMQTIVRQRALMMFSKLRVWDTEHNNGVLIYVLLAEHAIELVADRGIDAHVGAAAWQAMVERMGRISAESQLEDGLTKALEEVSAALVAHFPQPLGPDGQAEPQTNELPDEPVLR